MTLRLWATTSCSSRAIRARSSRVAAATSSALARGIGAPRKPGEPGQADEHRCGEQPAAALLRRIGRHGSEQTTITLRLPGGQIVVTGARATASRFAMPVVGGTGAYAGAGGTLTVAPGSSETERLTVTLNR